MTDPMIEVGHAWRTEAPAPPRRLALVTGASNGIGRELTRLLASDGHDLEIVARDSARLETLARELRDRCRVSVRCFPRDLSEPGASSGLWHDLVAAGREPDVLVNNAGIGSHGAFSEADPVQLTRMLALNVEALTTLTRLALPGMRRRRFGRILNVASLAAHQPGGPGMAAYYASKAYVLSLSMGLARELKGSGVTVTALCPGPTDTGFAEKSEAGGAVLYRWLPRMGPEAVALAGHRGMTRGSEVVNPGLLTKLLAFAGGLPPRRLLMAVNAWLLKPVRG